MHYPLLHSDVSSSPEVCSMGEGNIQTCQSSSGCQVPPSSSPPSSIVTTAVSHFQWTHLSFTGENERKSTPLGSSSWNKPAKGKNERLVKEICPVCGQNHSSFYLPLFTEASTVFLRESWREPSPATLSYGTTAKRGLCSCSACWQHIWTQADFFWDMPIFCLHPVLPIYTFL